MIPKRGKEFAVGRNGLGVIYAGRDEDNDNKED